MRCPGPEVLMAAARGSLAGEQRLRLEHHVRGCPRCAADQARAVELRGVLEGARAAEPPAVDWARVEAGLPWRRAEPRPVRLRWGFEWSPARVAVSMGLCAAAAAVVFLALRPEPPALAISSQAARVPAGQVVRYTHIPAAPAPRVAMATLVRGDVRVLDGEGGWRRLDVRTALREGSRVRVESGQASLQWEAGTGLSLRAGSEIALRALEPGVRVELVQGRTVVHVEPRPVAPEAAPRVVIASAGQRVEVRGTVLEVGRERAGTAVLVREGKVDVRGEAPGAPLRVAAGELGRFAAGEPGDVAPATAAELGRAERDDATYLLPAWDGEPADDTALLRIELPGAIEVDGLRLGAGPVALRVPAGRHHVAAGGQKRWLVARPGQDVALLRPRAAPEAPPPRGRVAGAGDQNERAPEANACYERHGLQHNRRLEGVVQLLLELGGDGAVTAATIGASTLASPAVERCLVDSAMHWTVPTAGRPGRAQYWITFVPRE